jgi:cleavage and polyadenylation specificity factor subunit 2
MEYTKLSVADLKSKLNAANVPFASNAIKSKLIALLQAHDQKIAEAEKQHAISLPVSSEPAIPASSDMGDGMEEGAAEPAAAASAPDLDDQMLANFIDDPEVAEAAAAAAAAAAEDDNEDDEDDNEDDNDGVGGGGVRVVPLYGCETFGPTSVLIVANRMNVLVDCGFDDTVDTASLQKLKRLSSRLLAVLLTHPSIDHIGALPLLVGKFGCSAPIYASQPVKDFARWILYDYMESKLRVENFTLFNRDDIDLAVSRIRPLSWSQDTLVLESELPLQIKAVRAGCVIGASSWRLSLNGADVVYLGRFNHACDNLVDAVDVAPLLRPDVVIADAGIRQSGFKKRLLRGTAAVDLKEEIEACLHRKGDVIIVIESGGRGIDAMHHIASLKKEFSIKVPMYYVSSQAYRIIVCAETQMEWVKKDIINEFSTDRKNVLKLPQVSSNYTTWEDLRASGSESPRIIFCSQNSLNCGAAADIFPDLCSKEHNLFVLTGISSPGSLPAMVCPSSLISSVVDAPSDESPGGGGGGKMVRFMRRRRVPLQGAELKVWEAERKLQKDRIHREKTTVLQIQENQAKIEEDTRREEEEDADQDMHDELKPKHLRAKASQFTPRFAFFSGLDTDNMKFDDFGAVVDWESVLKHANYEEERSGLVHVDSFSLAVADEEFEEIPYKYEEFEMSVHVNCKVSFWDIADRADAQAVARTICDLHPRKSLFFGSKKRIDEIKKVDKDSQRKIPGLTPLSTSEPTIVNVSCTPATVTISRHVAAAINLQRVKREKGASTSSEVWISQLRAEVKERDNGILVLEATDRGSSAVSGTFRLVFVKSHDFLCDDKIL